MAPELSVVVPMYDEEDVLPLFVDRLRPVLDALETSYEVIAVDDGSTDLTPAVLQRHRREWPQLRVLRLRANAGHQAALSAGACLHLGDYVVTLDADLQDPPEVIATMLEVARREGVDVVYGDRVDRSSDSVFKRTSAAVFYRVIRVLSGTSAASDVGDFRLMSRATVEAVNATADHHRVLRLIVPALGFPSSSVEYRRAPRAAGVSKYPFFRMLRLSIDSVTGFSVVPLRIATFAGLITGLLAILLILYILVARGYGYTVAGWTSTVIIVSGFASVQLISLGIMGEYVGRMYAQLQARPPYFIAYDSSSSDVAHDGPTDTPLPPLPGRR